MDLSYLTRISTRLLCLALLCSGANAQDKKRAPFKWVNKPAKTLPPGISHSSFKSKSMGLDVGYCIYLPPGYDAGAAQRYPVVYHLHGGRPGSELKSIGPAGFVDRAIRAGEIAPTIYVFPNGGPMSWYNYPPVENGLGEDVFIKELIPHIDQTYLTVASRGGRAIEGFSQGGRGTTRIMFKYPQLFCSAAPGGSGYGPEKRIQENAGAESDRVSFAPGYNAWDLAKSYAEREGKPELNILLWVGTKGFNYEFNLKFSDFLDELEVPHRKLVADGIGHSAKGIYGKRGEELMKFHQRNFSR
ncbi:MAG: alpha/beta hydrolase [Verrucomicrobiales bacterium]